MKVDSSMTNTTNGDRPHLTKIPGRENYRVPAGRLDSAPDARPGGSIFWGSRAQWYVEPAERPKHDEYEKQP